MCTIGLIVAMVGATDLQPPQPTAKPTVVRFQGGPVIVSHGVRPYLASGFAVRSRSEQPRVIEPGPRIAKPMKPNGKPAPPRLKDTPKPRSQIKNKSGKWIRFEPK